jgi:hypothetical protein
MGMRHTGRRFARAHRQLLDAHAWALVGLFSHPNPGLNVTRIGGVALDILSRALFANDSVVATFSGLLALNYGWSAFASARDAEPANAAAQVRAALAALPRSDYPRTAAVADEMATYGNERHYDLHIQSMRLLALGHWCCSTARIGVGWTREKRREFGATGFHRERVPHRDASVRSHQRLSAGTRSV